MSELAQPARVVKRSLVIAGHATSVSLEEPFWTALRAIAADEGMSVAAITARIDRDRAGTNLSSALRMHVLTVLQARLAVSLRAAAGATGVPAPD